MKTNRYVAGTAEFAINKVVQRTKQPAQPGAPVAEPAADAPEPRPAPVVFALAPDVNVIRHALQRRYAPGQIVELRVPGVSQGDTKVVLGGVYNDQEKLVTDIVEISAIGSPAVYVGLQMIKDDASHRNAVTNSYAAGRNGAGAGDIDKYRWLLIDVDAIRAESFERSSSSDSEKAAALVVLKNVAAYFAELGFQGDVIDSGNSYHFIPSIDLPATFENERLIKKVLESLAARFDTREAQVDTSVFDRPRICKLPGTPSRKGISTPGRPHRLSTIVSEAADLQAIPVEVLLKIAGLENVPQLAAQVAVSNEEIRNSMNYVRGFADWAGLRYGKEKAHEGGIIVVMESDCPFPHKTGGHHAGECHIGTNEGGKCCFSCKHNSCRGKHGWKEFRAEVERQRGEGYRQASGIILNGMPMEQPARRSALQTPAESPDALYEKAIAAMAERQQAYDELAGECDRDEQEHKDPNPYPLDAWEGTPYHLFAEIGSKDNYIPSEYLVSALMTITGAVCGNRISPDFNRSIDGRFYTVLLSRVGQIGKGECCSWGLEVYKDTGLIFRNNEPRASKNIGTWIGDFGSARGMLEKFVEHPTVLQYYPEVSTAFEKFGINGSGSSFKDLNLNLYDSTYPLWGFIKGMKIPESAPKELYNSILASTTTPKWDIMHAQYHSEDFFQRQNIVPSDETRRVFALVSPDVTPVRSAVLPRVGLLTTHRLIWSFSPEAKALGEAWFNEHQEGVWGTEEMSDAFGRIQVFIHRILCHLALWLGPLPATATKQDLNSSLDLCPERSLMDERPWFIGEGVQEPDKVWSVTITPDMMRRALRLADHQLVARRDNRPPQGISPVALVENLMKKWMPKLRRARKSVLFSKIDAARYGYDIMKRALDNLVKQDFVRIEGDPQSMSDQRTWIFVWVGDGRKTKKWIETRGGARRGAGRKKTSKEPVS